MIARSVSIFDAQFSSDATVWAVLLTLFLIGVGILKLPDNSVIRETQRGPLLRRSAALQNAGRARYLVLYLTCGVAAALIQALSAPHSHVPMIGASGAIAGVLGAYAILSPRANVHVFVWIVIFLRIVNVPAWALLGLWFLGQLISGLEQAGGRPAVAFWTHTGGFVVGMFLVTLLRRQGTVLLRPQRSAFFATAPPRAFVRERLATRGSVPSAGRPYGRSSGPRDGW